MAIRTSCSVGSGLSRRNSISVVNMPGVQKPHCRPWLSRNASCSGWSSVSLSEMRAGQTEIMPDEVRQGDADLDLLLVTLAVDGQRDGSLVGHALTHNP